MRIYLMAVGTQDPFASREPSLIAGPILSFLDQQTIDSKDWIVLISTQGEPPLVQKATVQRGEATEAELLQRYPALSNRHIIHESLTDIDPSDFGAIAGPMRQLVQDVLQRIQAQISPEETRVECIVNVSPGTPQMQAVWYLMAHAGQLSATLRQTKQGTGQITTVSINPLIAEQFIELGLRFFQGYSFRAASESFKQAAGVLESYEPERARRTTIAQEIAAAYHDWSIFQHPESADGLSQVVQLLSGDLRTVVVQQIGFLRELPKPIPKRRAINLLHAARLEYDRHDMIEAIWRAGAAYEQVLLERALQVAEQQCGFRPDPFEFRSSIKRKLADRTLSPQEHQRLQAFHDECSTMKILKDYLGISLVKPMLERWDRAFTQDSFWDEVEKDVAWVRNNAVHRSEPISRQQVMQGFAILREALERTFGQEITQELDACPFSSQRLTEMRKRLAALLKG